jgi:hypothetical protein
MATAASLSRCVAGLATTDDHSALIQESHIETGHRSWKATKELIERTR